MDSRTNRAVLTDPFTGEDLWLFPAPPPSYFGRGEPRKVQHAILTAAPYSKNCRIVLYSPTLSAGFWICNGRSSEWSYRHLSIKFPGALQLILHRHKIYAITFSARIIIIDALFDLPIVTFLPEGRPSLPLCFNIGPFIAEFNGQLLFIHCDRLNPPNPTRTFRIQVYRLSEPRLVRMESIGNCALFIDTEGSVMACANPGGWGAKENHIYLTGPRCKSWKEVSVGGLVDLPEFSSTECWKRWPRPLWVLPTSCY